MKKFFTLMILSAFVAVSAFADDSSLGDVKWSIKDGAKINPAKTITLTFPNATGFEFGSTVEIACNLYAADEAPSEDNAFDGIEGTITDGVAFILPDFEVQESTSYILKVTSILVNGAEVIGDTVYTLNFATRGAERQLSWTFQNTTEDINKLKKSIEDGEGLWTASSKGRFAINRSYNNEEVMLNQNEVLPITEGLLINCASAQMIVGNPDDTPGNNRLQFNGSRSFIIPDCLKGDEVSFDIIRATKGTVWMQVLNAVSDKGIESSNGIKDSVWCNDLYSSRGTLKFVVQESGDLVVNVCGICLYGIDILPGDKEKAQYTYSVKAVDPNGNVIKEIIPETVGEEGDQISDYYSYWMKTAGDSLVTYGTKGNPFKVTFDLKSDTTFTINYKETGIGEVKYLIEMEDLVDGENLESPIQLCTNANAEIRSSNGKAAYCAAEEGYQLTTLPAGKYKIRTVLFDANKTASYMPTFMVGSEEVTLSATSTNFAEVESGVIEITEESPVILKQSGNDKQGIDIIAIYATDELPEPDFQLGDANGDGEITMADANMVVNYFLAEDKDSIENFNFDAADANQDGEITMADANKIVNIFLGTDSVVE